MLEANVEYIKFELEGSKHFNVHSTLPITDFYFSDHEKLKKVILGKVESLKKELEKVTGKKEQYNAGGTKTKNIFTNSHHYYNILRDSLFKDEPIIKKFKLFLTDCFSYYSKLLYDQEFNIFYTKCWLNRLEKYEYLDIHNHYVLGKTPSFSCHYDLSVTNYPTYTCYYNIYNYNVIRNEPKYGDLQRENVEGTVTCFPGFLPHKTTPVKSDDIRYTLGMDIIFDDAMYDTRIIESIYEPLEVAHG